MAKGKMLGLATKAAVSSVKKAARAIGKKVVRGSRRRRVRRVLRAAAATAVTTGAGVLAAAAVEETVQVYRRRRKLSRHAAFEVAMPMAPAPVIEQLIEVLKDEGFGVLTRIDAHTVFEQKLGVKFRPYTILGVCNPHLAHRALGENALVGLMLPCTVTVEAADAGGSIVRFANPEAMLALGGLEANPVIKDVMTEAMVRLHRAADGLR